MYVALFIQVCLFKVKVCFQGGKMQEKVITEKKDFYLYISQCAHLQYASSTQVEEKKKKIYMHAL